MLNVKLEVKLWFKTLYWLKNLSSSAFSLNTTTSKAFFAQKVLLILATRVKLTDQNKISKTVYWPRLCPQISKLVNVKWKKRKSITQVWHMVLARYYISLSIKIFLVLMEVYNTARKSVQIRSVFWFVFFWIRTEYANFLRESWYSVRI